mmetsp:Transcript_151/g.384  ORF Transcript_151/g.384 Transcript_151/m.384 type:complete len:204 (+) Transcript_151:308-919(+)
MMDWPTASLMASPMAAVAAILLKERAKWTKAMTRCWGCKPSKGRTIFASGTRRSSYGWRARRKTSFATCYAGFGATRSCLFGWLANACARWSRWTRSAALAQTCSKRRRASVANARRWWPSANVFASSQKRCVSASSTLRNWRRYRPNSAPVRAQSRPCIAISSACFIGSTSVSPTPPAPLAPSPRPMATSRASSSFSVARLP